METINKPFSVGISISEWDEITFKVVRGKQILYKYEDRKEADKMCDFLNDTYLEGFNNGANIIKDELIDHIRNNKK